MAESKGELNDNIQQYVRKGQWKKALAELEKLYALDKSDPQVTLRMGDMCLKLDDKESATKNYIKTAGMFAGLGHVPKAVATYKMILRIDPSLKGIHDKIDALVAEPSKPAPPADRKNLKVDLSKAIPGLGEAAKGYPEPIPVSEPVNAPVYELETSKPAWPAYVPTSVNPAEGSGTIELSPTTGAFEIETIAGESLAEEQFGSFGMKELTAPSPKAIPLLFDLSHEETWDLLSKMKRLNFDSGSTVVKEGEHGDSLYIIRRGSVRVVTKVGSREVVLANLGERDFFGEVSFLTGRPRTADIIANEPTEIMELAREDLDEVTKKHPKVAGVLRLFHESRVADTVASFKAVAKNFFK